MSRRDQNVEKKLIWRVLPACIFAFLLCSSAPQAVETQDELNKKEARGRRVIHPPYSGPLLLTSLGQDPAASIVSAILDTKTDIEAKFIPLADPKHLEEFKTLVVCVGVSSEGLKTAGTRLKAETERAKTLLEAAKTADMAVVLLHLEGQKGRDESSMTLVKTALDFADALVVQKAGNEDGYFTEASEKHGLPLHEIERYMDLADLAEKIFASSEP